MTRALSQSKLIKKTLLLKERRSIYPTHHRTFTRARPTQINTTPVMAPMMPQVVPTTSHVAACENGVDPCQKRLARNCSPAGYPTPQAMVLPMTHQSSRLGTAPHRLITRIPCIRPTRLPKMSDMIARERLTIQNSWVPNISDCPLVNKAEKL